MKRAAFVSDPADPRHGTTNGYSNLRCRCDRCRRANTESHNAYMRAHREQRIRDKDREFLRRTGRDRRAEREDFFRGVAQTIERVARKHGWPDEKIADLRAQMWNDIVEQGHVPSLRSRAPKGT